LTSNPAILPQGPVMPSSHLTGSGMPAKPTSLEEVSVFRRFSAIIGLVSALAVVVPAAARAQVNIDQGKTPAEIFAADCAVCHKSTRGLANGKNTLMLSSFLREHYTASRDQAGALAAYVLGAGGNAPAAPAQKPASERAKLEEPKTGARPAKPDEEKPATARLQRPSEEPGKPVPRGRKPEPEEAAPAAPEPAPAPVAAAPVTNEAPKAAEPPPQDANPTTSAAAPAESQPSDSAPVPRDDIPD
jgi:hypothetical protein